MLKFDPIFSDNVVLQAQKPIRIYGSGNGKITVTIGSNSLSVFAKNGYWLAEFPALEYGEICDITATDDTETVTVKNATLGDVFLLAGQSNMQFKLREGHQDGAIYESNAIRLFSPERLEDNEFFKVCDGWVNCDKDTALDFSAIGYFVAREHHKAHGHAVGLVSAYQGASVIQSWMSQKTLDSLATNISKEALHIDHYYPAYSKWNKNSVLYDFAVKQVAPFSYKAVIWYQGESNTSYAESKVYDRLLTAMISDWRELLADNELNFVIIQIADFDSRNDDAWKTVQIMQEKVAKETKNCFLAISADVCESNEIHPPTKHILAKRVADLI